MVYDALGAIVDGTWSVAYAHWDEVTVPEGVTMRLSDEEVLTWRTFMEWPDVFRVVYIGKADH